MLVFISLQTPVDHEDQPYLSEAVSYTDVQLYCVNTFVCASVVLLWYACMFVTFLQYCSWYRLTHY